MAALDHLRAERHKTEMRVLEKMDDLLLAISHEIYTPHSKKWLFFIHYDRDSIGRLGNDDKTSSNDIGPFSGIQALHTIPIGEEPLILKCPVVYCYSSSILGQTLSSRASKRTDYTKSSLTFFGNPTSDSPAGAGSATILADKFHGQCFIESTATKDRFLQTTPYSDIIHFHGHVITDDHPLNHAMIFHGPTPLQAREVFALHLSKHNPLVMLIGCGSGRERIGTGDEPLGFISAFLFAGTSAVLGTMWPIHDRLSGAAFSKSFFGMNEKMTRSAENRGREESDFRAGNPVDLARRWRKAALEIRANAATAAPYFWAGFVLCGEWKFRL